MNRKKPFPLRRLGKSGYRLDPVPEIDQFIPIAAAKADELCIPGIYQDKDGVHWDTIYHQEMDRLTSESGLRVL